MTTKKTAPKKNVVKKVATKKKVSKEFFSTKTNFMLLALFCFFLAVLFRSLYSL